MFSFHTRSSAFVSICPEIWNTTHKIGAAGNKYARNLYPPGGFQYELYRRFILGIQLSGRYLKLFIQ